MKAKVVARKNTLFDNVNEQVEDHSDGSKTVLSGFNGVKVSERMLSMKEKFD